MANLRAPLATALAVTGGTPSLRAPLLVASPVTGGVPQLRAPLAIAEAVTGGEPELRASLVVIQALIPVLPEGPVASLVFPTLRGLTYPVKKTAQFNTGFRQVTSGRETATAFMAFPWWLFELSFEYLPDRTPGASGYTDYRTLQGFFLQLQGRFGTFLFCDPDDFHVVAGQIATADGVTLQFPFVRNFGGFFEPVGQVDLSTLATFAAAAVNPATDTITIPAHGLITGQSPPMFISNVGGSLPAPLAALTPYWPIAVDANTLKLATSQANALSNTAIDITVAGSGTDTFAKGWAAYDNGMLLGPSQATLALPNQLVFAAAPTGGHVITADFDFWFVCRIQDDKVEFDKFMDRLWEAGKLEFRSVIQ